MRITSDGKLLLGTSTNGGYNVSIYAGVSAAVSTANGIAFRSNVTGTTGATDLQGILWNDFLGNDLARILPVVDNTAASAATSIRFFNHSGTSIQERMRITSGGYVGIGTTAPSALLTVAGNIYQTNGSASIVSNKWGVFNGGATTMDFDYNSSGAVVWLASGTEKMRLTGGGGLLIGKTSSANTYGLEIKSPSGDYLMHFTSTNGSYNSDVYQSSGDGTVHWRNGSCDVYLPRTAGTWVGNSDSTIKENINLIDNSLNKLMQLNGYTYNLIDDKENSRAGLLAQEVEAVLPEAVHTTFSKNYNRNIKGVEYDVLIPLLVNSIKELKAENDTLKEILQRNNIQ
jgi:hypothetical protein